jgi:hypothetical protein
VIYWQSVKQQQAFSKEKIVQPINYTALMPQVNIPQAIEGFGEALQARQKRIAAEEARKQYAVDVEAAFNRGDQRSMLELLLKYPGQEKAIGRVIEGVDAARIENEFMQGAEISTALENNAPEVAKSRLQQLIEANQNTGRPTRIYEDILSSIEQGEETGDFSTAKAKTNFTLSLIAPDKYKKMVESGTRGTAEAGFRPITAEERRAFGLPADVPFQISPKGEVKEIRKGPLVSIDTGARFGPVAAGYERYTDDAGVIRERLIPGSPAEQKLMQEADQAKGRQEQLERAGGTVVQDIMRALNIVQQNPAATGRTAAAMLMAPAIVRAETDVQAAKAFVESALSNVGLDTLQRMRENSPTGGALGQVPIQQQQRLEQVLGSLDLTQRKEVVEDNMKRVINIYMDIIHGSPQAINKRFEDGLITQDQKDVYSFRHRLSFDELGNPLPKAQRGRAQQYVPPAAAPAPAAPAQPPATQMPPGFRVRRQPE